MKNKIDTQFDDLDNYNIIENTKEQNKDLQGNFHNDNDVDNDNDDSDLELDGPSKNVVQKQKEINENTINRLQAIAMSDDEDYGMS